MDNMRKNHPYNINNINNTNEILSKLYGIIFISFRLNESTEYSRYNELALCYYIDNIINKLNKINTNKDIVYNKYIYNIDKHKFNLIN